MDISALCSYICWQDDSINIPPTTENLRNHFRIILRFRYQGQNPDDVGVLHSYQLPFFWCSDRVLSGDEEYRRIFALKLVPSGLPRSVQKSIVNDLNILAHSMVKDHKNLDRKILPIAVDVVIRSEAAALARVNLEVRAMELRRVRAMRHDDDDVIARATRESMEVVKFVPATKSSIEALEKSTILNNNSCLEVDQQCRICLETLPIGAEVTCMPCSHIFHGNCIVRWLECSNLCPLCRFAMPC